MAYVKLLDGQIINEIMFENSFAIAYEKIYCKDLPKYQALNLVAKTNAIGLYQESDFFKKCLPYVYPVNKKSLQSVDMQGFRLTICDLRRIRTPNPQSRNLIFYPVEL